MEEERFVLVRNRTEISILDVNNDVTDENILMFSIDFEDNEIASEYVAYELEPVVRLLNEQDRMIKEMMK